MQLTQKETMLLKDLKDEEQLCADKYAKHSSCAVDPQLKNLFSMISSIERGHYDTLCSIEGGNTPQPSGSSNGAPSFTATYTGDNSPDKQADAYLCTDLLASEKHASHLYDTCVFEFNDENIRNTLNHIQKEEQQHGKMLYDYMKINGMYS